MIKLTYLAVFEPTENGAYSVYFPDLPGCISCGDNYEAAFNNAKKALGLHIYGMEKDGDAIPEPSKEPQIEEATASGYLVSPVSIYPDLVRDNLDNKAVKTNITLPMWLKDWASAEKINLSQTLQSQLRMMYNLSNTTSENQSHPAGH